MDHHVHATTGPQAPGSGPGVAPDALVAGSGLGKYRILHRVRAGRRATLYKARDTLLDRLVVVKQLAAALTDNPAACGRFRKEAYLLAQLPSDLRHVVTIHELIEEPRGLFIVTEYAGGTSLEAAIAKRRVSMQAALEVTARLALGLRAIHNAGIIHRDLAPRHVVLDPAGFPKITDFSLAAAEGTEPDYAVVSTPYTAPEIYARAAYDDRVDIYSLGVVTLEMLVGRAAFHQWIGAEVGRLDRREDWARWHARPESRWPEAHEIDPGVPPLLSAVVSRMTSRSLDERFASVDDVLAMLLKHFGARARVAEPPVTGTTSRRVTPERRPRRPEVAPRSQPGRTHTVPIRGRGGEFTPLRTVPRERTGREERRVAVSVSASPLVRVRAPGELPAKPRPTRRRRALKRGLAGATMMIAAAGMIYGGVMLLSRLGGSYAEVEAMLVQAREAYDRNEFLVSAQLLREASEVPVRGLKMYEANANALRWLPFVEARLAMQNGDISLAEEKLREATNRGLDPYLVNPLQREMIKAASKQRLQRKGISDELLDATGELSAPTNGNGNSHELSGDRDYQAGLAILQEALERRDASDAQTAYQRLKPFHDRPEVDALAHQVRTLIDYRDAMTLGDSMVKTEKFEAAIEHYRLAQRCDQTPEIQQKLNHAISMAQIVKGRDAYDAGDLNEAQARFEAAAWRDPESSAKAELERVRRAREAIKEVERGDAEAEAGRWAAALQVYNDAFPHLPEKLRDQLSPKIDQAKIEAAKVR